VPWTVNLAEKLPQRVLSGLYVAHCGVRVGVRREPTDDMDRYASTKEVRHEAVAEGVRCERIPWKADAS
jgi:hypothetical protein